MVPARGASGQQRGGLLVEAGRDDLEGPSGGRSFDLHLQTEHLHGA